MNFSQEELACILAVLDANDRSFLNLLRAAELRPDRDLVGADLQRVDFGDDDYTGFDFASSDLCGSNLARARGLGAEMFVGARFDDTTCWPDGLREAVESFDVELAARDLILAGRAPPASWRGHIHVLDLSGPDVLLGNFDVEHYPWKRAARSFTQCHLLQDLRALRSLNLRRTKVRNLDSLAYLTALLSLDLSGTEVDDISPLGDLRNLRSLDLTGVKVIDLSSLARLSALENLYLSDTPVCDITPLATLFNLELLALRFTQVSDVKPLAGLIALKSLHLSCSLVKDVSPLATLTGLQSLYLSGTEVTDVAPLANLSALRDLYLTGTKVSHVGPLSKLSGTTILLDKPKKSGRGRPATPAPPPSRATTGRS